MPEGSSIIPRDGDGASNWDSTAYNMILVNETARFLDDHLEIRAEDPFFAYVALGSVHIPHRYVYFCFEIILFKLISDPQVVLPPHTLTVRLSLVNMLPVIWMYWERWTKSSVLLSNNLKTDTY